MTGTLFSVSFASSAHGNSSTLHIPEHSHEEEELLEAEAVLPAGCCVLLGHAEHGKAEPP